MYFTTTFKNYNINKNCYLVEMNRAPSTTKQILSEPMSESGLVLRETWHVYVSFQNISYQRHQRTQGTYHSPSKQK